MHINNSVKYSKLKSDLKTSKIVEASEHRLQEREGKDGVKLLYTLDLIWHDMKRLNTYSELYPDSWCFVLRFPDSASSAH